MYLRKLVCLITITSVWRLFKGPQHICQQCVLLFKKCVLKPLKDEQDLDLERKVRIQIRESGSLLKSYGDRKWSVQREEVTSTNSIYQQRLRVGGRTIFFTHESSLKRCFGSALSFLCASGFSQKYLSGSSEDLNADPDLGSSAHVGTDG